MTPAPSAPHGTRTSPVRVSDLSLARKLGQMIMGERAHVSPDEARRFHLGSVLSGAGSAPAGNRAADWVALNDAFWEAMMRPEPGHVPIPLLYAVDAVHGHAAVRGATVFPHHVGLGAAHDPDLVARVAATCAREVLATGLDWNFAPTLAIARTPRWGRTYESFGADPALVAAYADRYVRAMQGTLREDGVLACAKHWVGDGATVLGEDQGDTRCSLEELHATDMPPYAAAIAAGVLTVMASFSSWNGVKCHANRQLLTDELKGRLGFEGLVVSDWDGVDQVADDLPTAVALAVNAGVDIIMVSADWRRALSALESAVATGAIPMARIDDAVHRILHVKACAGLFERARPSQRPGVHAGALGSAAHRAVAREAVRKSCVLLKHEGDVLPLSRGARVLVAGRNGNDRGHQCGGFTLAWQGVTGNDAIEGGTSVWEAIRHVAPQAEWSPDGAAADPARHDVAVVVIGERPYAEGQGDIRAGARVASGAAVGLRTAELVPYGPTLELAQMHPEDLATIRTIAGRGIPVVAVLLSGRPLVVTAELAASAAFVAAWWPGSEGAGVADVLFGDHDFTGRLPFPWPARMGETPAAMGELFPRGYGLRAALVPAR